MYAYIIAVSFISFTALAQERVEYPYSLIPGGIANDADFELHRNQGRLAEHYADVGFLRPRYLPADRKMWTSYTRDDRIFWTPVMIRKGELVLQDRYGNMIRGRCGNRLSDTPRNSVEFVPPTPDEWETPNITYSIPPLIPSPIETVDFPPFEPPPGEEGTEPPEGPVVSVAITPPVLWIPLDVGSPVSVPFAPIEAAIPEPGTSWLILGGLLLVSLRRRRVCSETPSPGGKLTR